MGDIAVQSMNTSALAGFYEKFGFKGLARALAGASEPTLPGRATEPTDHGIAPEQSSGLPRGETAAASMLPRERDLFDDGVASDAAGTVSGSPMAGPRAYDTVLTWQAFDEWMARILRADLVAIDTETTSLDEMVARIVGISFSVKPGEAAYIPLAHAYPDAPEQLPLDQVLARLRPWLEDKTRPKLGQHVKYDRHVFAKPSHRGAGVCP